MLYLILLLPLALAALSLIRNDRARTVILAAGQVLLLAVFALSFMGFGVKAAIWPLHGWLPSAAVAPTPVTALLHAVAVVKAGAFACIRLI